MKTLIVAATLLILAYTIRQPALRWVFTRDHPPTPDGWEPKLITWKNGVRQ